MPEGDTIFRTARTLERALAGQRITGFRTELPFLARVEVDSGVTGRIVEQVEARGKWLLIRLSGDLILLTHMRMSGSWHIYRPGEAWQRHPRHMRIALDTAHLVAVCFSVQVAEFHTAASLARREGWRELGPALLAKDFDAAEARRRLLSDPDREVAAALLDQSVVAGAGNVFKSEICFAAGVNPFRSVASLTPEEADSILVIARKFLLANAGETSGPGIRTYGGLRGRTGRPAPETRLWVYSRGGQPCRRCATPIRSRKQEPGARVTFWCPLCQPLGAGGR